MHIMHPKVSKFEWVHKRICLLVPSVWRWRISIIVVVLITLSMWKVDIVGDPVWYPPSLFDHSVPLSLSWNLHSTRCFPHSIKLNQLCVGKHVQTRGGILKGHRGPLFLHLLSLEKGRSHGCVGVDSWAGLVRSVHRSLVKWPLNKPMTGCPSPTSLVHTPLAIQHKEG